MAKRGFKSLLVSSVLMLFSTITCVFASETKEESWIVGLFQSFGSEDADIKTKTASYDIEGWRSSARTQAVVVGRGSCAIPGFALLLGAADFAALMRNAYDTSIGTGYLMNGTASHDDFATILGIWSGDIDIGAEQAQNLIDLVNYAYEDGKISHEYLHNKVQQLYQQHGMQVISGLSASQRAAMAAKVPKSLALKIASKLSAKHTGAIIAGKLSSKIAAKASAKMTAKASSKGILGHIPVAGIGVCAGVNTWIINGFIDASDKYYSNLKYAARNNLEDQRPFPYTQAVIACFALILFMLITSRRRSSSSSVRTT